MHKTAIYLILSFTFKQYCGRRGLIWSITCVFFQKINVKNIVHFKRFWCEKSVGYRAYFLRYLKRANVLGHDYLGSWFVISYILGAKQDLLPYWKVKLSAPCISTTFLSETLNGNLDALSGLSNWIMQFVEKCISLWRSLLFCGHLHRSWCSKKLSIIENKGRLIGGCLPSAVDNKLKSSQKFVPIFSVNRQNISRHLQGIYSSFQSARLILDGKL